MSRRPHAEDPPQFTGVQPEQALIAALLRTLLADATRDVATMRDSLGAAKQAQHREEARAWLRDKEAVIWWITLAGLPETTYDALLEAAGLEA
jgi:hypothetical protein